MPTTLSAERRDALRDRFRTAFGERLHRLILYGSYPQGETTPLSDVDLLVVLEGSVGRAEEERAYAVKHTLRNEYDLNVSPLVAVRERFDTYDQPLFRNVRSEGKVPQHAGDRGGETIAG